jgi:hypothetical protein
MIQASFAPDQYADHGEGVVDLERVDVILVLLGFLAQVSDGRPWGTGARRR